MEKVTQDYKHHARLHQTGKALTLEFRFSSTEEAPERMAQARTILEEMVRMETIRT
jgi:hypothetical protein